MDVAGAGSPIAHLTAEFVGEDVADHGFVGVSWIKNPVGFFGHAKQRELQVIAVFVLQLQAVRFLFALSGTAAADTHFGATGVS